MKDCLACRINRDENLALGGRIKVFDYWILDHCVDPVPVLGWLVLKTKRHTEGIMGMTSEEAEEMGYILHKVPKILQEVTGAEMIYVMCMTELVRHLHFHIIPRAKDEVAKGTDLFMKLPQAKKDPSLAIKREDCLKIVQDLKMRL